MTRAVDINDRAVRVEGRAVGVGQGSAIPDSVVNRWPIDEGGGSTLTDSVGDTNATNNDGTWTGGNWVGDFALSLDGNNDYIDTNLTSDFGSNDFGFLLTINTTDTTPRWFGSYDGGSFTNGDIIGTWDDDAVKFRVKGDSGSVELSGTVSVGDGNKHRVLIRRSAGDIEIWVDGSLDTSTTDNTGSITTAQDIYVGGTPAGDHVGAVVDDVARTDGSTTMADIENDYDRQPWS